MHWRSSFFCREVTFGPSEKKDKKKIDINRDEMFQKRGVYTL